MDIKQIAFTRIDGRGWMEIIVVCVMSVFIWVKNVPHETPVGEYHSATSAPEIRYVDRQVIVPKQVIVYRDKAKQELDLPTPVVNNPDVHVLEASKLVASEHPQTAVCLQDSQTGKSEVLVKIDPMPWLAAENRGEARFSYGFKNGMANLRLSGHEDLISIKSIHLGVDGSLDKDGQTFYGIGAAYKW